MDDREPRPPYARIRSRFCLKWHRMGRTPVRSTSTSHGCRCLSCRQEFGSLLSFRTGGTPRAQARVDDLLASFGRLRILCQARGGSVTDSLASMPVCAWKATTGDSSYRNDDLPCIRSLDRLVPI